MTTVMTATLIFFWGGISLLPQPVLQRTGYVFFTLVLASALAAGWAYRGRGPFIGRGGWLAAVFVACLGAGAVNALDRFAALRLYSMMALAFGASFTLGKSCLRTEEDFGRISAVVCVFMLAVGIVAAFEIISGRNILYEFVVPNTFYVRYTRHATRPMSTLYNPVIAGSYYAGCLPFAFYFIDRKGAAARLFGRIVFCLGVAVIFFAASRGVFLGLIAALLCYFVCRKKIFAAAALCGAVLLLVAGASFIRHPALRQFSFGKLVIGSQDSIVSQFRIDRVAMAFRILKDHPVAGIGPGHFRFRFYEYARPPKEALVPYELMIPDNMYMSLVSEAGGLGIIGFVALYAYVISAAGRRYFSDKDPARLIILSGLTGLLVNMAAYDLFYWHTPLAVLGFLSGAAIAGYPEARP